MTDFFARNVLPMLHALSLRLEPLMTAQDGTELTRRAILLVVAAFVAGWAALKSRPAAARRAGSLSVAFGWILPSARALAATVLPMALAGALLHPMAAAAEDRAYMGKSEIVASLLGKPVVSRNLASGTLSNWEFRRDGSVQASRSGLGRASGTWSVGDDGQMCVTMMNRTGCRYWFRKDGALANSDTRSADAVVVAEVRFAS